MNDAIARFAVSVYTWLLPVAWVAALICLVVAIPLAFFSKTRSTSGLILFFSSWVIGATTWFLGAAVTFATWGWVGLIIGLVLAGVGVVPIGILAAFISLDSASMGFSLIAMVVIVMVTRAFGLRFIGVDV